LGDRSLTFPLTLLETVHEFEFADNAQKDVFTQYIHLYNIMASLSKLENVLEIGAGYSTVVLALLAREKNFRPHVIDYGFDRVLSAASKTKFAGLVEDYVERHEGTSITGKTLTDFYQRMEAGESFCGVPLQDIIRNARENFDVTLDARKVPKVAAVALAQPSIESIWEELVKSPSLIGTKKLLDVYSDQGDYLNEIKFLDGEKPGKKYGILNKLLSEKKEFDAIFLDSGELAGNPEFEMVVDRVRIGGIIGLHDVFFPKSFKNFLPCGYLRYSSDWAIIHDDKTTRQGMLVAKRIR
jgi:predicted O-methyltransferase YrrM